MHPPRMSAPSCIVPPTEQLVIPPPLCHSYLLSMGWKVRIPTLILRNLRRYMEAINACHHHGFDTWLLVSYFYDGMSSSMKQLLELCVEDIHEEVGRMKSQPNAKGGMYVLNEDIDMKAKVAAMARRLEELEMKKGIHEVEAQEGESSKVREVKAVITLRSVKYKDSGYPTISVSIRGTCGGKALLDLEQV
ncbi:hypothetical protein CK203_100375 [Vitis vinifera]|uniref:Uncharacterized protein n=1 Tax=Vitis vinifera TaxID=29760 RepID=A0A438DL44_VITVI|nr:hypothetical protein CK203_100375 [Vitis vinifera]